MAINSFTWAQIKSYVVQACGETDAATAEVYDHMTAAYRELATQVDSEELHKIDATIAVASGADVATSLPADLFAIRYIFNLTTGQRLEPEEGGMQGRSRFLEVTTGKPPSGKVHHYHRAGGTLYVRDKADEATTLQLHYKYMPPDITSADDANRPVTPRHMDWAIIYLSAANYFRVHPHQQVQGSDADGRPTVVTGIEMSRMLMDQANTLLVMRQEPHVEEHRDRREATFTPFYNPNP